jgi:hypothetical protein
MEKTFEKVEEMAGHVKEYFNNRLASVKLNAAEKTSKIAGKVIAVMVVAVIFLLFMVFASIALAYLLGKWTGEMYQGFLIVAGIYLLSGILIWAAKERWIRLPIMNAMLQQLFKEEEDED